MRFRTFFATMLLASAQMPAQIITLTYEATFNGSPVPLDSIRVMNLDQGGDTTIVFPSNILVLGTTGLADIDQRGERLVGMPNPFAESTDIMVHMARPGELVLVVHDALGREVAGQRFNAAAGMHSFRFSGAGPGMHMVVALCNGDRRTLRLVASSREVNVRTALTYLGHADRALGRRSERSTFLWQPGDELRCIGYATDGAVVLSSAIDEVPSVTATRTFTLLRGAVCPDAPVVADIDGNVYRTAQVGGQCWTAEDLRVATYANGDAIPDVTGSPQWSGLTTGASCSYNNTASNDATTGKRYNWFAASDPRGLCPQGWHVATDQDWMDLESALGMPAGELNIDGSLRGAAQNVGGRMKALTGWNSGSVGNTDEVGLAMPGTGQRNSSGGFANIGLAGYWWSATPSASTAWMRIILASSAGIFRSDNYPLQMGYCIRCLKD